MSASTDSNTINMDGGAANAPPHVEALFLIRFDKKVGYTIAWKRSRSGVNLDNGVEFKSLPSGLHSVQSDLVYFSHEGYAGLSAFARGEASEQERNANFVSVGILVEKEGRFGRLGRAWLLAARLEKLAAALAEDSSSVAPLEEFWDETCGSQSSGDNSDQAETKKHGRARALSTASAFIRENDSLPDHHPALSILQYIDMFGPLVFRLQQAALLRKRILFVGSPPVRTACEFVYNLSVLSSISPRDAELLIPDTEDLMRLPCLFSVGVHDIPYLDELRNPSHGGHTPGNEPAEGWAACTTDEIIATKAQLYDIVIELPSAPTTGTQSRCCPKIRTSDGSYIRASQRDLARYKILHKELFKYRNRAESPTEAYTDEEGDDTAPLISREEVDAKRVDDELNSYDDSAVEPMTWSRLAYLGFMWWASAGERDAYTTAERDTDRELVGDLADYSPSVEAGIIAYFHRQTSLLIQRLSQIIDGDPENEEREHLDDEDDVVVDRDDLSGMGLDTWSEADRAFVQEFGSMYFGRSISIKGSEVDCCGLRVPVF